MTDLGSDVKDRIAGKTDKDLVVMLMGNPDDYVPDAWAFAQSEAQRRGITAINTATLQRLEEEEAQQAERAQPDAEPYVPIGKARGLRAIFDLFVVFAGFPIARFISLAVPASAPADLAKSSAALIFASVFVSLVVGDLFFRSAIQPRKSKAARGFLAAAIMIPCILFNIVGNDIAKGLQSRRMAQLKEREANKRSAPYSQRGADAPL